ncbi:hypothetical protein Tco_1393682 [Tanacetum coccineum]
MPGTDNTRDNFQYLRDRFPILYVRIGTNATWEGIVEKFTRKFYHIFDHIEEEEDDEDYDPHTFDDVPKIFKIKDDLFSFDTPLCIAFDEFNYLLKIDLDIFIYEIQKVETYDEKEQELNNDKTQGPNEPWSENRGPYQPCNHICEPYRFKDGRTKWPTCSSDIDGFCNGGEIPGMYNGQATSVILKRDKGHEEAMVNPTPKHSVCKIRRFEMMKYSFDSNDEYITIKEFEHLNHSKKSIDAYRELLRLTNEGWVVTTSEE